MTVIRKLEICTGLLTPLTGLVYPGLIIYSVGLINKATGSVDDLITNMGALWLFTLPVAACSYLHAAKQTRSALVVVCLFCVLLLVAFGSISFLILIWNGPVIGALAFLPAPMSAVTAVLGIISHNQPRSLTDPHNQSSKQIRVL